MWKDKETIAAVAQYLRLLTGILLSGLLIYMFASERIDLETVIKAMVGLLAIDRFGMAITSKSTPPPID